MLASENSQESSKILLSPTSSKNTLVGWFDFVHGQYGFDLLFFPCFICRKRASSLKESAFWGWDSVDLGEGVSGPKAKKSPRSLEKASRGLPAPGSQKSEKSLEKRSEKSPKTGDFFETFWRLFGFWPRDSFSQVHGISILGIHPQFWMPMPTPRNLPDFAFRQLS